MSTKRRKSTTSSSTSDADDVWHKNPNIIRQFIEQRSDYEQLCTEIAYILNKRLKDKDIEVSTVTWRAKTLNSFLTKIQRKKYKDPFGEITDFAGVRVVCLYLTDIPNIEVILSDEFEILEKVDKLNEKGADRFGYGAIHFVAKLGKHTLGARYDDLKDLVCEIQVRTVLQDAWAIIDHHLVYKNESDVPTHLQRKLNSLAGLFETADDQFDRVRTERAEYLNEVRESKASPHQFLNNELNKDSFMEYLKWKFPQIPTEYYEGQSIFAFNLIDKEKYKKLSDLDAVVEKSKKALPKVNSDLKDLPYVDYAAAQVALSFALVDEKARRSPTWAPEKDILMETLQKHAV